MFIKTWGIVLKNSNMTWTQIKEKRSVKALNGPTTIEVEGLIREDGFKIAHEAWDSLGHGKPDIFECSTTQGKFRFSARRYKEDDKISTTYTVSLISDFTSHPEMCRTYAKDIESALLSFPPVRYEYRKAPVEKILYLVAPNKLVSAEELSLLPLQIIKPLEITNPATHGQIQKEILDLTKLFKKIISKFSKKNDAK